MKGRLSLLVYAYLGKALSIFRISDSLSPACTLPLFQSTTCIFATPVSHN